MLSAYYYSCLKAHQSSIVCPKTDQNLICNFDKKLVEQFNFSESRLYLKNLSLPDTELLSFIHELVRYGIDFFNTIPIAQEVLQRQTLDIEQKINLIFPLILSSRPNKIELKEYIHIFENSLYKELIIHINAKASEFKAEFLDAFTGLPFAKEIQLRLQNLPEDSRFNYFRSYSIVSIYAQQSTIFKTRASQNFDLLMHLLEYELKHHDFHDEDNNNRIYRLCKYVADSDLLAKTILIQKSLKLPNYMQEILVSLLMMQYDKSQVEFEQEWSEYLKSIAPLKSASKKHKLFKRALNSNLMVALQEAVFSAPVIYENKKSLLCSIYDSQYPTLMCIVLRYLCLFGALTKEMTDNLDLENILSRLIPQFKLSNYRDQLKEEPLLINLIVLMFLVTIKDDANLTSRSKELLDAIISPNSQTYYTMRENCANNEHLRNILEKRPDLKQSWFKGHSQKTSYGQYNLVDTDDWRYLLFYGMHMQNCMSLIENNGEYNKTPLDNALLGDMRIFAIVENNKVIAYMNVCLDFNSTGDQVVLYTAWPITNGNDSYNSILLDFAQQRASALGCTVHKHDSFGISPETRIHRPTP